MDREEWEDFKRLIDGRPSLYGRIMCCNAGSTVVYVRASTLVPVAISHTRRTISVYGLYRSDRRLRDYLSRRDIALSWESDDFYSQPLQGLSLEMAPVRSVLGDRIRAQQRPTSVFKANRTRLDVTEPVPVPEAPVEHWDFSRNFFRPTFFAPIESTTWDRSRLEQFLTDDEE